MPVQTVSLTPKIAHAVSLVGNVVTYRDRQFVVHSIEGADWYTFQEKDGTITVDVALPHLSHITERAMIIPSGHVMGEGFGQEVPLSDLRRGVCLVKW